MGCDVFAVIKIFVMKKIFVSILFSVAASIATHADIIVRPDKIIGSIKPMHAVNNGPKKVSGVQALDNFETYKAACIPFARTHDAAFSESYGREHTVDISAIFPDFGKDPADPASYDFAVTDEYLKTIREAGTEVFFRLGQKIEHLVKKYDIYPPRDFRKWAEICEHIILHYNEGWADGYRWNIRYWEIWNEPDYDIAVWNTSPRTWGGSEEQFHEFYFTVATYLKGRFPNLKIGGPAIAGNEAWADRFLSAMAERKVPMDFFSWHMYSTNPDAMAAKARRIRALMDKYGYTRSESILNEWNYIRNWNEGFPYSIRMMRQHKGGAFSAAVMCACQNVPVDMLMYYDARPETPFNGLFDLYTFAPTPAYYAFYAWSRLCEYAVQVEVETDDKQIYAVAAVNPQGRLCILVSRYADDDNVIAASVCKLRLDGSPITGVRAHLTDIFHSFTEVRLWPADDGTLTLALNPNSFIMIEI